MERAIGRKKERKRKERKRRGEKERKGDGNTVFSLGGGSLHQWILIYGG